LLSGLILRIRAGSLRKRCLPARPSTRPDLFVAMYVRHEAVLSSQIEGTQSTLGDVLEFGAAGTRDSRPKDVEEVVNHLGALNYGLE